MNVKAIFNNVRAHLPIYIGVVLVIVNALVDAGYLNLPLQTADVINAVLAALGLGVLHVRQNKS